MFQTILKADKQFKNRKTGNIREWKGNANIAVTTYVDKSGSQRPTYASVTNLDLHETIVFPMAKLHKLSEDFVEIDEDMVNDAITDSVCESMTGERVEPDGYDEFGLPSIVMAMGLC